MGHHFVVEIGLHGTVLNHLLHFSEVSEIAANAMPIVCVYMFFDGISVSVLKIGIMICILQNNSLCISQLYVVSERM